MQRISLPQTRAYYAASRHEPERLLYWIPPTEMTRLVNAGLLAPSVRDDYPDGLEIEVSEEAFRTHGLCVGVLPEDLRTCYLAYYHAGALPEDGMVLADDLEAAAQASVDAIVSSAEHASGLESVGRGLRRLTRPLMSAGDDPLSVMRELS
jgi:hypothetical protein